MDKQFFCKWCWSWRPISQVHGTFKGCKQCKDCHQKIMSKKKTPEEMYTDSLNKEFGND